MWCLEQGFNQTTVDLHAITMEKLQFALLMVFTIGPSNNFEALKKYAMLLANVKELRDAPDSEYFAFLSRKAHEGASNQARIDVAEARMRGEIGESEKTETELKRLRATNVTKPKIAKEVAQQKADAAYHTELEGADGAMYAQSKNAEIAAFRQTNEAESTFYHQVKEADASFYTRQKQAEADAYVKQKKAEGIAAKAKAKAYGALADVPGGPQGLIQDLMLENDTYVELVNANGEAIRGLQPKISVWNNMKAPPMGLIMERPALDNRPSRLIRRPALLKRDPDKNEASVRKIPNMVLLRLLKKAHFLELHLSPEHSGEDERLDELLIPRRAEWVIPSK
jgi:flotillin